MAKTFTAAFAQSPKTWVASVSSSFNITGSNSVVNDNPNNVELLVSASAEGALVTDIRVIPRFTQTTHWAGLFLSKDAGTTKKLVATVSIIAQTISPTNGVTEYSFTAATETAPLRLEAGDRLYVGLSNTQPSGSNFFAKSVDY